MDDAIVPAQAPPEVENQDSLALVLLREHQRRDGELAGTSERSGGERMGETFWGEGRVGTCTQGNQTLLAQGSSGAKEGASDRKREDGRHSYHPSLPLSS
jgi:hypothetical protein